MKSPDRPPAQPILVSAVVIGAGVTVLLWMVWALVPGLVTTWEWSTYDLRLRLRGPAPTTSTLVIIGRDARSDARFGLGIWDRALMARMIDALDQAGAAVVAPDFYFGEPSPEQRGGLGSDEALIAATEGDSKVVYPMPIRVASPGQASANERGAPVSLPDNGLRDLLAQTAPTLSRESSGHLPSVQSAQRPLAGLVEHAAGVGHMAANPDADGVYRHVAPYVRVGPQALPAYGVAIAATFLEVPPEQVAIDPEKVTLDGVGKAGNPSRTLTLPLDSRGRMLINYAGEWSDAPFPYLSFVDVWDAIQENRLDELAALVKGKIVVILHASLEADKRRTPLELKAPGGFIHANVVNTILTGHTLREIPVAGQVSITLLMAVLSAWAWVARPGWPGLVMAAVLGTVYAMSTQGALEWGGLVLPVLMPLGAVVLGIGGAAGWTAFETRRRISQLEADIDDTRRDLAAARETLAVQESTVEHLEETLAAAQAEAANAGNHNQALLQQVEQLRGEVTRAHQQADHTRATMRQLEARLADFRTVAVRTRILGDPELERLRQEGEQLGIITQEPAVLTVFRDLKKAARSTTPVLLLGETGSGKELFARALHRLSPRTEQPFVAVNMAAISPDLVESELFGHVKGAFTGAVDDRKGYFEQAHHGTIFLDEIGDLRPELQAKLLRVLQEGVFYRIGAKRGETRVDVRVVAATNRDLGQGMREGWFREDLFYRLTGIELRLPPLRERRQDLPLLASRFVEKAAAELGRPAPSLTQGALDALARHTWPGNIRELERTLGRAVTLSDGDMLTEQDLRIDPARDHPMAETQREEAPGSSLPDAAGDTAVLAALRRMRFDMKATAQVLGWDRSTVTQRLKGMCFQAVVEHGGDRRAAAEAIAGDPSLAKVVEIKLNGYYHNLLELGKQHDAPEQALAACRKRLKNVPERHMPAVETLIRQAFEGRGSKVVK